MLKFNFMLRTRSKRISSGFKDEIATKRACHMKPLSLGAVLGDVFDNAVYRFLWSGDLNNLRCCSRELEYACVRLLGKKTVFFKEGTPKLKPEYLPFIQRLCTTKAHFPEILDTMPNLKDLSLICVGMVDYTPTKAYPKTLTGLWLKCCPPSMSLAGLMPWPQSLKYMHIDWPAPHQLVREMFPVNLEVLVFGGDFNCQLTTGDFPVKLKALDLGQEFNQPIAQGVLPNGLTSFAVGGSFSHQLIEGALPQSLKQLTLISLSLLDFKVLPQSLEQLFYAAPFARLPQFSLPASLTTLLFVSLGEENIGTLEKGMLPSNLLVAELSGFDGIVQGALPRSLYHLHFHCQCDLRLEPNMFPDKLVELALKGSFNQRIPPGVLPKSLERLILGNNFNQAIDVGVLPPHLDKLIIGGKFATFNQPFKRHAIPPNVTFLDVGRTFSHPLTRGALPRGLRFLWVDDSYRDKIRLTRQVLNCPNVEVRFHNTSCQLA